MTDQFRDTTKMVPITPLLELFKRWEDDILNEQDNVDHVLDWALFSKANDIRQELIFIADELEGSNG